MDKRTLRQTLSTSRRGWLAQASGLALGAVVAPTFASVGAEVPVSGHAPTKGLNNRRDGTDEEWLIQGTTIVGTSPSEAVSIGDIHVGTASSSRSIKACRRRRHAFSMRTA